MTIQKSIKINYVQDGSKVFKYVMKCGVFKATSTNGFGDVRFDIFDKNKDLPYGFHPVDSTIIAKALSQDIAETLKSFEPSYFKAVTKCYCGLCNLNISFASIKPKPVKFKTKWTFEVQKDIEAFYGMPSSLHKI